MDLTSAIPQSGLAFFIAPGRSGPGGAIRWPEWMAHAAEWAVHPAEWAADSWEWIIHSSEWMIHSQGWTVAASE